MPTLPTPAVDLNYVQVGEGADLVMIHGLGANLSFWYFGAARLLSARHRMLMYDLRGHGRSSMPREGYGLPAMADDLARLMSHAGVETADIVGHSFGGRVALAFALLHPERVRRLIVADTQLDALQPPTRLADWPHWPAWRKELAATGMTEFPSDSAVIDYKLLVDLNRFGGNVAEAGPAGPRRVALRSRDMGAKSALRWQRLLAETTASREFDAEQPIDGGSLADIAAPTLLMFGKFSHCLPTAYGLLDRLPEAKLVLVPGAGHFFPVVKPVLFANALERFLAAAPPARRPRLRPLRRRVAAARALRKA
jgi:pimeloyl-ACP methyl ester carboxylesterase